MLTYIRMRSADVKSKKTDRMAQSNYVKGQVSDIILTERGFLGVIAICDNLFRVVTICKHLIRVVAFCDHLFSLVLFLFAFLCHSNIFLLFCKGTKKYLKKYTNGTFCVCVPITTRHSSMNVTLGQVPSTMTDKEGEKDTLQLSQDGQYLSGKMDKDTPFKLKRKK